MEGTILDMDTMVLTNAAAGLSLGAASLTLAQCVVQSSRLVRVCAVLRCVAWVLELKCIVAVIYLSCLGLYAAKGLRYLHGRFVDILCDFSSSWRRA